MEPDSWRAFFIGRLAVEAWLGEYVLLDDYPFGQLIRLCVRRGSLVAEALRPLPGATRGRPDLPLESAAGLGSGEPSLLFSAPLDLGVCAPLSRLLARGSSGSWYARGEMVLHGIVSGAAEGAAEPPMTPAAVP